MYSLPVRFSFKEETIEVIKEEERYNILDIYDFIPNYMFLVNQLFILIGT